MAELDVDADDVGLPDPYPPTAEDLEHRRAYAAVVAALVGTDDPVHIGRFVVRRCLGSGGMGVVYAAHDDQLDRDVAVKLLHPEIAGAAEGSTRLQREAQAMARLSHPNVVHVYEVGSFENQIFVAMELLEGPTLRKWLEQTPRAWPEVVEMLVQAGRGLAAAHAVGVVHRDFKPENVIVREGSSEVDTERRACVLDFGLARPAEGDTSTRSRGDESIDDAGTLTRTGALLGTPAYMSPEQLDGRDADARSDQFSFCVAFWEALFGVRPFAGNDVSELGASVREGRISSPPADRKVPAWLRRAIERGLRTAPDERWPSMAQLLAHISARRLAPSKRWLTLGLAAVLVGGAVTLAASGISPRLETDGTCDSTCECLIAWDRRVAVLVEVMSTADAEVASRARYATVPLGDPAACELPAEEAALVLRPLPADTIAAADVFRVRLELAELDAAVRSGANAADMLARRRELQPRAAALGFASVEAEAQLGLAIAELEAGSGHDRAAELAESALLAAQSGGDAAWAAVAAAEITWVHAVMRELGEARSTRPRAEALVAQAPTYEARQWLLEADASLASAEGRWDDSIAMYEACIATGEGRDDPSLHVSRCRREIAAPLIRAHRGDEAIEHVRTALADREALVGSDHPLVANALQDLAVNLLALDRGQEAAEAARRALAIRKRHGMEPRANQAAAIVLAGQALAGEWPEVVGTEAWSREPAALAGAMNRLWPFGHVDEARRIAELARQMFTDGDALIPVARQLVMIEHYAPREGGDDPLRWLEELCAADDASPRRPQCLDVHLFRAFRLADRGDIEGVRKEGLLASAYVREHLGDALEWRAIAGFRRAEALLRAGSPLEAAAASRDVLELSDDALQNWDRAEARHVAGLCLLEAGDAREAAQLLETALAELEVCCPRSILSPTVASTLARARDASTR